MLNFARVDAGSATSSTQCKISNGGKLNWKPERVHRHHPTPAGCRSPAPWAARGSRVWTDHEPHVSRQMDFSGEHDVAAIARVVGVSRSSPYRALVLDRTWTCLATVPLSPLRREGHGAPFLLPGAFVRTGESAPETGARRLVIHPRGETQRPLPRRVEHRQVGLSSLGLVREYVRSGLQ